MFKKKLSLILLVMCILGIGTTNVFAASSGYSFYMEHRMVDGKANGEFHYLDEGNVIISGTGAIVGGVSTLPKRNVYFTLVKDGFFDREIGTVVGDEEGNVYAGCGSIYTGKYYLKIWITEEDGYYRSGWGQVYNN
ncbi:hypothetical protein [Fusibacter sp. 3D3]|uniref:hypothetical protein n=1 Tax=Fusibacter sp. 3D3 TaxID=1048380 RepID=UPI0008530272|nr:hypothetical protein [Fusibacter sp. 3D3]GAU78346.1 hypothetical protein F3D3_2979 [Fusibacter sp. 3D3]